MGDVVSVQTSKLAKSFAQRFQANRADLIDNYSRSLRENLFTNRTEMRPREVENVATEVADALINALSQPHLGMEQGAQLCQSGLSEQTVLSLNQTTRRFVLTTFENGQIPQALDIVDAYQNAVARGYIQSREKLILAEQERIRGALQVAIGRYTVEIKDIQELAQRATEANQFKTLFIARISHELRTPLGALLGISEMLQQSVYGPLTPAQLDIVQRIINNTHTLERIFTELLDQSQLESGQLRLRQEEFSPQSLVQTVHSNNLPLALQKKLSMHLEIDPALPSTLIGDRARVEQIFSNLIVNAIKYTRTGAITVRASMEGTTHWLFQVEDSGIGIADEDLPFVFEPFRQVSETFGSQFGGVGLGLAIVKQLVTAMDGTVHVESKLGQGSTFTVTLPLHSKNELTKDGRQ